jgi:hypothetical protein
LTSNNKTALEAAAMRYGGTVREWAVPVEWRERVRPPDHRYELFTTADTLDVIMRGDSLMTTYFEQWRGAYCVRRCDGRTIIKDGEGKLTGRPCQCPEDPQERRRLAREKPPQACDEKSRITLLLEGLPLGQWRLDTGGFYAAAEIRGLQAIMRGADVGDCLVKAVIRLEERTDTPMVNGQAQTYHYPCVVIEPRITAEALLALGEERRQLQASRLFIEARKQLPEHVADLYGDAAGEAMRALPAAHERSPLPAAPEPGELQPRPAQSGKILQAIEDLLIQLGRTSQQRNIWRGQMARKYAESGERATFSTLRLSVLESLQTALLEEIAAKAPAASTKPSVAAPDQSDQPAAEPWRQQLHTALALIDDATLKREAEACVENPDSTVDEGLALLSRINAYLDNLNDGVDDDTLPF